MKNKAGLFITLEGPDGSGKSTILSMLSKYLIEHYGDLVIFTREPGGKGVKIAEKIRDLVLDLENTEMSAKTEMLLYAAARAQHVEQLITPALKSGKIILCDRFVDSSIAYQGGAREIGINEVAKINKLATNNVKPDLTILFMIDKETSNKRLLQRKNENNRLDIENLNFKQNVLNTYEILALKEPKRIKVIDARQSIEEVFTQVKSIMLKKIKNWQNANNGN